jgi:uncharacterized membrane protein (UPF0127 family)
MQQLGKALGFLAVFVILCGVFYAVLTQGSTSPEQRQLGQTALQFEIVRTAASQEKGLSGRTSIPSNYGMLFVFPEKGTYSFWMKDMLVPIDILWLDEDGTVLESIENVSPDTYPHTFTPPSPVRLVLEMKAGEANKHSFFVGTRVPLPNNWRK